MARHPLHPCKCGRLVRTALCERCEKKRQEQPLGFGLIERSRLTSRQRGYTSKWDKARKAYLQKHPLCTICEYDEGRVIEARVVDHIIPHRGDMALFWDTDNWQPLCTPHHNRKTMQEIAERRKRQVRYE